MRSLNPRMACEPINGQLVSYLWSKKESLSLLQIVGFDFARAPKVPILSDLGCAGYHDMVWPVSPCTESYPAHRNPISCPESHYVR